MNRAYGMVVAGRSGSVPAFVGWREARKAAGEAEVVPCGCGKGCSRKSEECRGQVTATKYRGHVVEEHLCEFHREKRRAR